MIDNESDDVPFPPTVLVAAVWSFSQGGGQPFEDAAEFDRRVREYHVAVTGEDSWEPDEVVLAEPRVRITCFALEAPGHEYTDLTLDLHADDGAGFTASELLRKLHNALAPKLVGADHVFFEGLFLAHDEPADGMPVYELMQGS
jgi:hypothetical protein